ncbi:MAG: L,D-transpeptidase [Burkholderiaceae bacterium]|nr:L,D-transpeptidase [Burkholderiaceae bacterium]
MSRPVAPVVLARIAGACGLVLGLVACSAPTQGPPGVARPSAPSAPAPESEPPLALTLVPSLPLRAPAPSLEPPPLAASFANEVHPRLGLPPDEQAAYGQRLQAALEAAGLRLSAPQFVVLVDRSPQVQAALLYWGDAASGWRLVGATPVSTGLPGRFAYFLTPLGVFPHTLAHPDFRAEGTKNPQGFRGYGRKGLRVYDFGWIAAQRTWGKRTPGELRLQMHATDPDLAEHRLGLPLSAGCVRIPATLNDFIDRHGLLDADYQRAVAAGQRLWVLRPDRTPTPTPGSYLVVIDTERTQRPDWSPRPPAR